MKTRTLVPLFLCVATALPGWAQQTNAGSPAPQTASASQSATDRQPLPDLKPMDFWDGDDPNLVNLVRHPFATKAYVQRHTRPIRDRINELDQLTSENSSMIKDVDARAQQGIQMASEKTSLADTHATLATSKAQLAQIAATTASTKVSSVEQMVGNLDQYKGSAQTEIRFRPGQHVLSKSAKDALDQMAGPLKQEKSYIVEVRGYAPGHGQAAIASSQKMADSVVRYLVLTHKIPVYRIYAMSMGNAAMAGEKAEAKPVKSPRVEVSVLQNDLASAAQR